MAASNEPSTFCERFERLYTGAITDTLDEFGYMNQTLSSSIAPLQEGMSAAGIAFPIHGKPNTEIDPEQNIRKILQMLGDVPRDSFLVYDTNDERAAHIGELTTESLSTKSCRGAVVNGGARDVEFIVDQDFPVFCRYRTPEDCISRWEILDWGVEVDIEGVTVSPGDFVVGDADGVVVIPEDIANDVLTEAESRVNSENEVRKAVSEGVEPLDAYDQYGAF